MNKFLPLVLLLYTFPCTQPLCRAAEQTPLPNAIIINDSGDASVIKSVTGEIERRGGRIAQTVLPYIITADMPPGLDAALSAAYAVLIFRDKIAEMDSVGKYGEQAAAAVEVWNNNIGVLSSRTAPSNEPFMEILIETDGANFSIISKKVINGPERVIYRQPLGEGRYFIEFLDGAGTVRHVKSVSDPAAVFFDYMDEPAPGQPGNQANTLKGGGVKLPRAQMLISLPLDRSIKTIKVSRQKLSKKGENKPAAGRQKLRGEASAVIPGEIELEPKALLEFGGIPEKNE